MVYWTDRLAELNRQIREREEEEKANCLARAAIRGERRRVAVRAWMVLVMAGCFLFGGIGLVVSGSYVTPSVWGRVCSILFGCGCLYMAFAVRREANMDAKKIEQVESSWYDGIVVMGSAEKWKKVAEQTIGKDDFEKLVVEAYNAGFKDGVKHALEKS